jgi:hypothetical protein
MTTARLSSLQRRILAWLWAEEQRTRGTMAASHAELVQALAHDQGNLSRSLQNLEAKGLVRLARTVGGMAHGGGGGAMSRGLGKLQREILAGLEAQEPVTEFGYHGHWFTPTITGLYDLRALAPVVAQRLQKPGGDGPFSAAFSRAVRGLVRRGMLCAVTSVPIDARDALTWQGKHKDAVYGNPGDGYVVGISGFYGTRQIRFVQLAEALTGISVKG